MSINVEIFCHFFSISLPPQKKSCILLSVLFAGFNIIGIVVPGPADYKQWKWNTDLYISIFANAWNIVLDQTWCYIYICSAYFYKLGIKLSRSLNILHNFYLIIAKNHQFPKKEKEIEVGYCKSEFSMVISDYAL